MKNSKLKHILLLAALACGTAHAEDNNTFYFTDAAVMPGETTNIELCMRNTAADLTCLEAEIQLPEGLSVVCDVEGNPLATLYRQSQTSLEPCTYDVPPSPRQVPQLHRHSADPKYRHAAASIPTTLPPNGACDA